MALVTLSSAGSGAFTTADIALSLEVALSSTISAGLITSSSVLNPFNVSKMTLFGNIISTYHFPVKNTVLTGSIVAPRIEGNTTATLFGSIDATNVSLFNSLCTATFSTSDTALNFQPQASCNSSFNSSAPLLNAQSNIKVLSGEVVARYGLFPYKDTVLYGEVNATVASILYYGIARTLAGFEPRSEQGIELRQFLYMGSLASSSFTSADVSPVPIFRYWRVNVTAGNGGGWTEIRDLELRFTSKGPDETMSLYLFGGSNVQRLFNTSTSSFWNYPYTPGVSYLAAQFSIPQVITSYSFTARNSYTTENPTEWRVQSSEDGTNWVTVETETTPANWGVSVKRTFTLDTPTEFTYMRFLIDKTQDAQNDPTNVNIAYLELFNEDGENVMQKAFASYSRDLIADHVSNAFNGKTTLDWWSSASRPEWIGYDFGRAVDVHEIAITAGDHTSDSPRDFQIQRSDDKVNWVTAWSVTGQTGWSANQQRVFKSPDVPDVWIFGATALASVDSADPTMYNIAPPCADNRVVNPDGLTGSPWGLNGLTRTVATDPFGGSGAVKLVSSITNGYMQQGFQSTTIPIAAGTWNLGVWHRQPDGASSYPVSIMLVSSNGFTIYHRLDFVTGPDWKFEYIEFTTSGINAAYFIGGNNSLTSGESVEVYQPMVWPVCKVTDFRAAMAVQFYTADIALPPTDYTYSALTPTTADTGINYSGDYTVSEWIDHTTGNTGAIFGMFYDLNDGQMLHVYANNTMSLFSEKNDSDNWTVTGISLPGTGLHHVVTRINSATREFRVTVDNVIDSGWISFVSQNMPTSANLFFGQRGNGAFVYTGDVESGQYFPRVLTDLEVAALYYGRSFAFVLPWSANIPTVIESYDMVGFENILASSTDSSVDSSDLVIYNTSFLEVNIASIVDSSGVDLSQDFLLRSNISGLVDSKDIAQVGPFEDLFASISASYNSSDSFLLEPVFSLASWDSDVDSNNQGAFAGIDLADGMTITYQIEETNIAFYGPIVLSIECSPSIIFTMHESPAFGQLLNVGQYSGTGYNGLSFQAIGAGSIQNKIVRMVHRLDAAGTTWTTDYKFSDGVQTQLSQGVNQWNMGVRTGGNVWIGQNGSNGSSDWRLLGKMRDINVFDQVLSDEEVASYIASGVYFYGSSNASVSSSEIFPGFDSEVILFSNTATVVDSSDTHLDGTFIFTASIGASIVSSDVIWNYSIGGNCTGVVNSSDADMSLFFGANISASASSSDDSILWVELATLTNSFVDTLTVTGDTKSFTASIEGDGAPRVILYPAGGFGASPLAFKAKVEAYTLQADEWNGFGAMAHNGSQNSFTGAHSRGGATLYTHYLGQSWDFNSGTGWSSTNSGSTTAYNTPPFWIGASQVGTNCTFYSSTDGITWTARKSNTTYAPTNFGIGLHTGWGFETGDTVQLQLSNITWGDNDFA